VRKLFDDTKIKSMHLANRLVRSATWEGMCEEDGRPTGKLTKYYETLAKGRIGLIISGYAFVREDGKQLPGQLAIHKDDLVPDLRKLADAVHGQGGKLCIQLVHCGGQTTAKMAGARPVAPSELQTAQYPEIPSELNLESITEIIANFATSASRAREAGCDSVQFHAAHGYLINQFMSPLTNKRTDQYGGDIEGRCRFLMEVYRGIRVAVGNDYPVLVKMNGSDNLDNGFTLEDAVIAARYLDEEGIDAIEVSGGTPASGAQTPVRQGIDSREKEAYNLPLAYRIKNAVSCPVMVVGGLRSFELVEGIIRREEADYIALSRPLIREPNLPRRWEEGNEIHARCISCNGCFKPGLKEDGIYCVVDKIERENRGTSL
jgi:2,4-dienoyl-CoA reductase-like NADH-dependent reductase (Old Yellow Enzyme family)